MEGTEAQSTRRLRPYLTPMGAWALSLGTTIGWGSLVVTSNTYLLQAGPVGSLLGLLIGTIVMVVVARNYHYLINCFPDAGGAYTYSKEVYGHDSGFITSWFLALTYMAVLWANVTSLPLFAHYFLGDFFKVGYLYTVFGYDVFLGEAMLSVGALVVVAAICARSRKNVARAMVVMALLFTIGIVVCYVMSASGFASEARTMQPNFLPSKPELTQILIVACTSPWAFIGFENISHSAEEFTFSRTKAFRIMVAAIITGAALYAFVIVMSAMVHPPEYGSWLAYISDLAFLDGIKGLPAFYVANHFMGETGVRILMVALLCLVGTSLVGNTVALSRLFHALGKDRIIPRGFASINRHSIPGMAIFLVVALSVAVPFLGRTAVGWIVDVTTIGATIVYAFVSACAHRVARARGDMVERATGMLGILLMCGIGANLLLPVLFQSDRLANESYFLFAAWGILGLMFFRFLLVRDREHRFGRSVVVWIALLSLVMFVSFVWMNQSLAQIESDAMAQVVSHYCEPAAAMQKDSGSFAMERLAAMKQEGSTTVFVAAALFALASILLLSNFAYMSRWVKESEKELDKTKVFVYRDPLTGRPSLTRFGQLAPARCLSIVKDGHEAVAITLNLVGMSDYRSRHGRDGANQLLRDFADVLRKRFGTESCARPTDNTFYVLTQRDGVEEALEGVFADFELAEDGGEVSLPVRAGLYVCARGEDVMGVGFDRAQAACDLDLTTWQSSYAWFKDTMSDEARLRLHVLRNVDQAIRERWIRPYYQAIVSSTTGVVKCEEALARWIDPEYGFLSPGQFIPILEEAGVLHKVDMHMIACVIDDMGQKLARGVEVVPVSINVSLRDLGQVDVASEVVRMVDNKFISHDLINIEFTESALNESPALFIQQVKKLREEGFNVWMDDFGSGYSSLNSLKDYEFDLVKLDMEFMRNEHIERTWDVIYGVAQITQRLGMKLLAEGVESELQARRLRDVGCDLLQGYYFAKPESLDDIIEHAKDGTGLPRTEA